MLEPSIVGILVEAVNRLVSFLSSIFILSASSALLVLKSAYENSLRVGSRGLEFIVGLASRSRELTNRIFPFLPNQDPSSALFFQVLLVASSLFILVYSGYSLRRHGTRNRAKTLYTGILVGIIFLSMSLMILGFPSSYLVSDVSQLSNLSGAKLRLHNPDPGEIAIVVPRHSDNILGKLSFRGTPESSQGSYLLRVENRSNNRGLSVTEDSWAAFRVNFNLTVSLNQVELLLSTVEEAGGDIVLRGYSDNGGRPEGQPLFYLRVTPNIGLEPEWLKFNLENSFLAFEDDSIWLVISVAGDGHYIWWISESTGTVGATAIRGKGGDWMRVWQDLCIRVGGIFDYSSDLSISVGRVRDFWSGGISSGELITVDISDALGDYLARSPENFEFVEVPVRFLSSTRAELEIADLSIEVEEPNPKLLFGILSLLAAAMVAGVSCLAIYRIQNYDGEGKSSDLSGVSLGLRRLPNTWEGIE